MSEKSSPVVESNLNVNIVVMMFRPTVRPSGLTSIVLISPSKIVLWVKGITLRMTMKNTRPRLLAIRGSHGLCGLFLSRQSFMLSNQANSDLAVIRFNLEVFLV